MSCLSMRCFDLTMERQFVVARRRPFTLLMKDEKCSKCVCVISHV